MSFGVVDKQFLLIAALGKTHFNINMVTYQPALFYMKITVRLSFIYCIFPPGTTNCQCKWQLSDTVAQLYFQTQAEKLSQHYIA